MKVSVSVAWIGNLEVLPEGKLLATFNARWWSEEPFAWQDLGAVPKKLEAEGEGCCILEVNPDKKGFPVEVELQSVFREWSECLGVELEYEPIDQAILEALERNPEGAVHGDICKVYRKWKGIEKKKVKQRRKIEREVKQVLIPRCVELRTERF